MAQDSCDDDSDGSIGVAARTPIDEGFEGVSGSSWFFIHGGVSL